MGHLSLIFNRIDSNGVEPLITIGENDTLTSYQLAVHTRLCFHCCGAYASHLSKQYH
jgi:hypothetical protein